jgi:hypothetical protein
MNFSLAELKLIVLTLNRRIECKCDYKADRGKVPSKPTKESSKSSADVHLHPTTSQSTESNVTSEIKSTPSSTTTSSGAHIFSLSINIFIDIASSLNLMSQLQLQKSLHHRHQSIELLL